MGPLADFRGLQQHERVPKLKWIDNMEDNKQQLRTNNSEDDLVCKFDDGKVNDVTNHKETKSVKPTIKPFKQTLSEVTGVAELTNLSRSQTMQTSERKQQAAP